MCIYTYTNVYIYVYMYTYVADKLVNIHGPHTASMNFSANPYSLLNSFCSVEYCKNQCV